MQRPHLLPLAVGVVAAASLSVWHLLIVRYAEAVSLEWRQPQRQALDGPSGAASVVDYVQHARAVPPAAPETLLHQLQSSLGSDGAHISSMSATRSGGTAQSLAFTDVSFTLEGRYGNLKQGIGGLLAAHPGLVLEHLAMRRKTLPADVEVQLVLRVVRPAAGEPTLVIDNSP